MSIFIGILGSKADTTFTGALSYAFVSSPYVTVNKSSCLTFKYFSYSEFVVTLLNTKTKMEILHSHSGTNGIWNEAKVLIPPGGYLVMWRSASGRDLQTPGYIAGLDDVFLLERNCAIKKGKRLFSHSLSFSLDISLTCPIKMYRL